MYINTESINTGEITTAQADYLSVSILSLSAFVAKADSLREERLASSLGHPSRSVLD